MVRLGLMPMPAAAACRLVVLKGAGTGTLRRFFSTDATLALLACSTWAKAARASLSTLKRPLTWVPWKGSSPAGAKLPLRTQ